MASPWKSPIQGPQSSVRPLRALLIVPLLFAIASVGSDIVKSCVLTIGMTCALIAVYWTVWERSGGSRMPPDLCTRCQRGLIARVAVSQRGDRFYQCTICGARYQRKSREDPWVDASGPGFDEMYSRQQPGWPCKTVALSDEESQSIDWTRTVDVLLRNKRIRQITGDGGYARTGKHCSSTPIWASSTAQLAEEQSGLWDSELDG
jgi:hypothetical protein